MKKTNWAEKIGFALIIIGFLSRILNGKLSDGRILQITENYQLIGLIGLFIWAVGLMKSQSDRKKLKNKNN